MAVDRQVGRSVDRWVMVEYFVVLCLYATSTLPFLSVASLPPLLVKLAQSAASGPIMVASGLLIAAVLIHWLCIRCIMPRLRLVVWQETLRNMEEHVAGALYSRASQLHTWIHVTPGAVGFGSGRLLLCDQSTRYEITRIGITDIREVYLCEKAKPPLVQIAYQMSHLGNVVRTEIAFHEVGQAECWFERLQAFRDS